MVWSCWGDSWQGKWGDRRQELVFIGVDMVEEEITALFDACLLNDHEMLQFEELMVRKAPSSLHPSPLLHPAACNSPLLVFISWTSSLSSLAPAPTSLAAAHALSFLLPTRSRRS